MPEKGHLCCGGCRKAKVTFCGVCFCNIRLCLDYAISEIKSSVVDKITTINDFLKNLWNQATIWLW